MAIEFNCPYCTATVRVGDDATGKIGRCPKCDTRLRIPTIPTAPVAPPASQSPPPREKEAEVPPQLIPGLPTDPPHAPLVTTGFSNLNAPPIPDNLGQLPIVPVEQDPVTSKYLKRRKKKNKNYTAWIPPVIFGGILVGIAVAYLNWNQVSFSGELPGERMNPNQSIHIELVGKSFNIDQSIFSQIVDEVRERPSAVHSNLVNLRFAGGANGLAIALRPGSASVLVKVSLNDHKPIAKFYKDHFDELDDARIKELQQGLISLARDWTQAPEGTKNETLPNYRNSVVYNSFVKGLGRVCHARIGNVMYPCIHEDHSGALYFLVPIGTTNFEIRERTDLEQAAVLPADFLIKVTVQLAEIASPLLAPDHESTEPASEGETVPEPMTETPESQPVTIPTMKMNNE